MSERPVPWQKQFWSDAWYGFRYGALLGWIVGFTAGVLSWIIGYWLMGGR